MYSNTICNVPRGTHAFRHSDLVRVSSLFEIRCHISLISLSLCCQDNMVRLWCSVFAWDLSTNPIPCMESFSNPPTTKCTCEPRQFCFYLGLGARRSLLSPLYWQEVLSPWEICSWRSPEGILLWRFYEKFSRSFPENYNCNFKFPIGVLVTNTGKRFPVLSKMYQRGNCTRLYVLFLVRTSHRGLMFEILLQLFHFEALTSFILLQFLLSFLANQFSLSLNKESLRKTFWSFERSTPGRCSWSYISWSCRTYVVFISMIAHLPHLTKITCRVVRPRIVSLFRSDTRRQFASSQQ